MSKTGIVEFQVGQYGVGQFPPLGQKTKVIMPKGLHEQGIALVRDLLAGQGLALPKDWDWSWLKTGRGEYVGTLPKRVSKYAWQTQKLELSAALLCQIGNLALQHMTEDKTYVVDFTQDFNWRAGDFGDYGSCFWGGAYRYARSAMAANSFWAIRFWNDLGIRGIGRAWLMPPAPKHDGWIVFNGYGEAHGKTLTTRIIGRVLAMLWNAYYKYITFHEDGNHVYVNSSRAVLVGTQPLVKDIAAVQDAIHYAGPDYDDDDDDD